MIQLSDATSLVRVEQRLKESAAARVLGEVPQLGLERGEGGVAEGVQQRVELVTLGRRVGGVGEGPGGGCAALQFTRQSRSLGGRGTLAAGEEGEEFARDGGDARVVRAVHRGCGDGVGDGAKGSVELLEEGRVGVFATRVATQSERKLRHSAAEQTLAHGEEVRGLLGDAREVTDEVVVRARLEELLHDARAPRVHGEGHLEADSLLEGVAGEDGALLDRLGGVGVLLHERLDLVEVARRGLVHGVSLPVHPEEADPALVVLVEAARVGGGALRHGDGNERRRAETRRGGE